MSVLSTFPPLPILSNPPKSFSPLKPKPIQGFFNSPALHLQNPYHITPKASPNSNISSHENPNLLREWPRLLQTSIQSRDFLLGVAIHGLLAKSGFQNEPFLGNNLINMYVKCNRLDDARQILDEMPKRNTITWTSLINGYSQINDSVSVFQIIMEMHRSGEKFSWHTCTAVLRVCGSPKDKIRGEQIHCLAVKSGFEKDVFVGTSLVSMYSRSGFIDDAEVAFKQLNDVDIRCLNSMILGYEMIGKGEKAFRVFCDLRDAGFEPNDYTFTIVISACNGINDLFAGRQLHALAIKYGIICETSVGNAVVTMYGSHRLVEEAQRTLYGISEKNLVSWTAIISAYVKNEHVGKAFDSFADLLDQGHSVDASCLATVLDGCSKCKNLDCAFQINGLVIKLGYLSDVFVATALVDVYAKCGNLKLAKLVFSCLTDQNTASFNAILARCSQTDEEEEEEETEAEDILVLFNQLRLKDMEPDSITLTRLLSLSADQASMVKGTNLHAYTIKAGFEDDIVIGNALITLYAKCGSIKDACRMFDDMVSHDSITWNAMVSAYALHGRGKEALSLFRKMEREKFTPDEVTLVTILQACSYSGLFEDGLCLFNTMERRYGIKPLSEHQACVVDLLGRAGHLSEAMEFVKASEFTDSVLLWRTLVNVCMLHGDLKFGQLASKNLLDLASDDAASHILVSNFYARSGLLEESAKVRLMMNDEGMRKETGCSWIEIDNQVHQFVAGGKDHRESTEIYLKLDQLNDHMKHTKCVPTLELLLQDL